MIFGKFLLQCGGGALGNTWCTGVAGPLERACKSRGDGDFDGFCNYVKKKIFRKLSIHSVPFMGCSKI